MDFGTWVFILVWPAAILLGLAGWYFSDVYVSPKDRARIAEETHKRRLTSFYKDCVEAKCTKISSPQQKEKIRLFAEKHDLSYPDGIEALWEEAKKACAEVDEAAKASQLEALRQEENEVFKQLTFFQNFTGRNKRIAMLETELHNMCPEYQPYSFQKESNPYTWGGIADGIAGAGAGVYTALKTEQENERIRKYNYHAAVANAYNLDKIAKIKNSPEYKKLENDLDRAKTCLVAETPANEVLSRLNISDIGVEISKTGAFTITAKAIANKRLAIYNNMTAVADGTIIAHLREDGEEIGTAKLVLPCFGVDDKESIELKGMGLKGAKEGKQYTVTFSAENLWLMER